MSVQDTIRGFLSGRMNIVAFRSLYDSDPAINLFLKSVIDDIKATGKTLKMFRTVIGDREYESAGEIAY